MKKRLLIELAASVLAIFLLALFTAHPAHASSKTSLVTANGQLAENFTLTMKQTRFPYRGGARIVPKFTLKYKKTTLVEGRDFKFWTTNAKAVGTATLSIRGLGRFQGTCRVPYAIIQRAAKYLSAKVSAPTFKATGKPITPKVTITYKVGNKTVTLKNTRDYQLTYKNNVAPGTAKVIVRYKGNYCGKKALTFTIRTGTLPVKTVLAASAGTVLADSVIDFGKLPAYFRQTRIVEGDAVYDRIIGKSYRENPDIDLSELRYLKVLHRNYKGKIQVGEIVCNVTIAQDLLDIFLELFEVDYQIYSMVLVDAFWTGEGLSTDEASVRANNTSSFNYRRASDSPNLSNHALGKAIDVNPRHNPYVVFGPNGWVTDPYIAYTANETGYIEPETRPYAPHAMTSSDACVQAFKRRGFTWGGDWGGTNLDYQHFDKL